MKNSFNIIHSIRSRGIKTKVLLFIVLMIILPYAAASFYSFYATSKAAQNVEFKALEETTALVEQDLRNNVLIKSQLYDLNFKHSIIDLESIKDDVINNNFTEKSLSDYFYKHRFVQNVYFVKSSGDSLSFPAGTSTHTSFIPNYEVAKNSLAGLWSDPYTPPGEEQQISYLIPVNRGNAKLGVIGIDITTSGIFNDIAPIDPSESSYVFIVRNNGEILTASKDTDKDLGLSGKLNIQDSRVIKSLGKLNTVLDTDQRQGSFVLGQNTSNPKVVTFSSIPGLGGKLYVVSPIAEILQVQTEKARNLQQAVRTVGMTSLIYSFVLAIIIVAISYILSERELITPLNRLRNGIKTLQSTNFNSRIDVHSRDELGELASAFNAMAAGLYASNKHLVEEHDRLQASINSVQVGFLMTDKDNNLLIINDAAKKLVSSVGKDTAPVSAAWTFKRVCDGLKDGIPLEKVVQDGLDGRVLDMEAINFGEKIFHVFAGPIVSRDSAGAAVNIGTVLLLEDITEAKVLERSRDEFFSIASHELRTPLTTIRGNSSMMLEVYGDEIKNNDVKSMVSDIHKSSVQLIEIVNDFLDVSRIEQGKARYEFAAVNLEDILESVIYETGKTANDKGISISTDTMTLKSLPKVAADRDRLKQIIYNLVGNAVKFTEKGSITIKAAIKNGYVEVEVADTGRGIPPENQKLLFHKFQQAGNSLLTRDTTRGTGLGLYLSRLLMENMGGTIELVKSTPGKGSTFMFKLLVASDENLKKLQSTPIASTEIDPTTGLTRKDT